MKAVEKVESQNVKLLGRGFTSRLTHKVFGIACVGKPQYEDPEPDCNSLRFIYQDPSKSEAYYIGQPILVQDGVKNQLKEISHDYKRWCKTGRQLHNNGTSTKLAITAAVAIFVGVPMLVGKPVADGYRLTPLEGWATVGGAISGFTLGVLLSAGVVDFSSLGDINSVSYATQDQSGWNWPSNQK